MNLATFFDSVRGPLFGGRMTAGQVDGTEAVFKALDGLPLRYVAYGLATALGEVGRNMQPVREGFKETDREAIAYVRRMYAKKYGKPAGPHGHYYYGRGYVQLTWLANYQKASKEIGVDFVAEPDLALRPDYAARIMREGMLEGWFTGKKFSDYLGGDKADYRNARRIINGTDRAEEIAGYARTFEAALRKAGYGKAPQKPVVREEPIPVDDEQPEAASPQPKAPKPKNTPISPKSRTAQGTIAAGAGGAVVIAGEIADAANTLKEADGHISAGTWIGFAIGALIIAGAAYAFYARWRDGGGIFPWERA